MHALLLAVAVLALAAGVWQVRKRPDAAARSSSGIGALLGALYFAIDEVPERLHHA